MYVGGWMVRYLPFTLFFGGGIIFLLRYVAVAVDVDVGAGVVILFAIRYYVSEHQQRINSNHGHYDNSCVG